MRRCKACNRLQTNFSRPDNEDTKSECKGYSIETKKKFFKWAKDKLALKQDATILLEKFHEEVISKETEAEFVGNSTMVDEKTLNQRYADRPEQLEAVKKNTRSFYCRTRETMLYADVEYTLKETDRVKKTVTSKRGAHR